MIQSLCRSFAGAHPLRTRWIRNVVAALLFCLVAAPGAQGLEAVGGRVQAHGFVEMQLRTLSKNYSDKWDLAQWYNIFNLELEVDLLQDTVGPLDLVSGYVRIEARFDCVYSRGCGVVKPANTFGNRAESLPGRLMSGNTYDRTGQITIGVDDAIPRSDRDPLAFQEVPGFEGIYDGNEEGPGPLVRADFMKCPNTPCDETNDDFKPWGAPTRFWKADRNQKWASTSGLPWETMDDGTQGAPFLVAMEDFKDFRFATFPVIGGSNGGHAQAILGPWLPENEVTANASMANVVNPMDNSRVSPASLSSGAGSNPYRPIPYLREDRPEASKIYIRDLRPFTTDDPERDVFGNPLDPLNNRYPDEYGWQTVNPLSADIRTFNDRQAGETEARGLFVPSPQLRRALEEDTVTAYNFNFNEQQRAFNRGASQQDEGELKEAYLDIEMFDSRLWMRVGKQTIVWGKTELFRTTDQFNPQDLALANLPSLEESRIALWAFRGVWSFYEVGPLSDVRTELAFNFDEFESADLGSCGEPFTINIVCGATFGALAHGFTGVGVVGQELPPDPWESLKGWEIGGRLEFRWDRFSFAITDFYGYDDFPHIKRLSSYARNVDWTSGRPRTYMHTPEQMALSADGTVGTGCATPQGYGLPTTAAGAIDLDPNTAVARVGYDGDENAGCLTPGPTNRMVSTDGRPYQVPTNTGNNPWEAYRGQFWNDTSRSDPDDPRPDCFEGGKPADPKDPCFALAAYDPRFDPNNELASVYGTDQGQFETRFANNIIIGAQDRRWLNAYDPTLRYDERNALEQAPVNISVFNWVCATTVGFNELDAGACATTVFSSSKAASKTLDAPVSQVLAGLLSGSSVINFGISRAAGDPAQFKYSLIPDRMGMPIMSLDKDIIAEIDDENTVLDEVLHTYDRRASWAVETNVAGAAADLDEMLMRSREAESYNCLSRGFGGGFGDNPITCGGFAWGGSPIRSTINTYFAAAFTPEQEALLGCGPFFGTECDSNGLDLLWAEGSSLLSSFIGNDSLGIAIADLGLEGLVPAEFGMYLMDNGSGSLEYRTDGRVIGVDGSLIRLDENGNPELGTAVGANTGLLDAGAIGHDGVDPCNLTYEPFFVDSGNVDFQGRPINALPQGEIERRQRFAGANRFNSRCWDLREYFVVKGIQPGTAAFDAQELGGPKCTTSDLGGPDGLAGVLPGCRNKWATIRYATPQGINDHPNNPASGYIGNNYLGDAGDATGQRTDYRQLDLATAFGWCPASNPDCNATSPHESNPVDQRSGLNWGVYSPDADSDCDSGDPNHINDPKCWLGGWVQDVDGDPDRVGIDTTGFSIDFPKEMPATSGLFFTGTGLEDQGTYGTIVQREYLNARQDGFPAGCTEMQAWIWMQRTSADFGDGYLNHAECAAVQEGLGAGHPFTGESFSNELSVLSFNFMMLLVAFSEEFQDGIASVNGFVEPEAYAGKLYSDRELETDDVNYDNQSNIDPNMLPTPVGDTDPDRWQRPDDLPDILDVFPDLMYYEKQSSWGIARENQARRLRRGVTNAPVTVKTRGENRENRINLEGKIFNQGPNGTEHIWRGLIRTMQWDYAFTGSENQLMAMIPQCEDERVTQQRFLDILDFRNPARIDCARGAEGETLGQERCTFVTPQHCSLVQALYSVAGQQRNIMRAGGNGTFGRRTMQWQSGGEVYVSYEKRNVLGFSMDFAEDVTKSNWSTEFTYINGLPTGDANSYELTTRTDTYNLTVSVDRPTFINFLNPNRTLFINSQWFFQYRSNYNDGMGPNGPWNVLATFAVFTGYFQDRLNPSLVGVYDFRSRSGAALPSINYRFSEAFSLTLGASIFFGRQQLTDMPVNGIAPAGERGGDNPYQNGTFGGVSLIKDRDEVYMTLRYTF